MKEKKEIVREAEAAGISILYISSIEEVPLENLALIIAKKNIEFFGYYGYKNDDGTRKLIVKE